MSGWVAPAGFALPPEVMDAAADGMSLEYDEQVQGEDYFETEGADEESEHDDDDDDDDDDDSDDSDDYYGYGYRGHRHRRERERNTICTRRWKRLAIVLWPTAWRLRILGREAAVSLLASAQGGDGKALMGYDSVQKMQADVAKLSGWQGASAALKGRMLRIMCDAPFPVATCCRFLGELQLADLSNDAISDALLQLLVSHGVGPLKQAMLRIFSGAESTTELGCQKAWAALSKLAGLPSGLFKDKAGRASKLGGSVGHRALPGAAASSVPGDAPLADVPEDARDEVKARIARLHERVSAAGVEAAVIQWVAESEHRLSSLVDTPMTKSECASELPLALEKMLGLHAGDLASDEGVAMLLGATSKTALELVQEHYGPLLVDRRRGASGNDRLDHLYREHTKQLVGGPPGASDLFHAIANVLVPQLATQLTPQADASSRPPQRAPGAEDGTPVKTLDSAFRALLNLEAAEIVQRAARIVVTNPSRFPPLATLPKVITQLTGALQDHQPKKPASAHASFVARRVSELQMQSEHYRRLKDQAKAIAEREWTLLSADAKSGEEAKAKQRQAHYEAAMGQFVPREAPPALTALLATLAGTLANVLSLEVESNPSRFPMDPDQLCQTLRCAVDNGAPIGSCLSKIAPLQPKLCTSVQSLLSGATPASRAAILSDAAYPAALLVALESAVAGARVTPAPAVLREAITCTYLLLGRFDKGADHRAKLASIVVNTKRSVSHLAFGGEDVLVAAIKQLHEQLDEPSRMAAPFRSLLAAGIDEMGRLVGPEPPAVPPLAPEPAKGPTWAIRLATPVCTPHCATCKGGLDFLADPKLSTQIFSGMNATHSGHLTQRMAAASKMAKTPSTSSFTVTVLSSKAAKVHGRMQITKQVAGALPAAQIAAQEQQRRTLAAAHSQKVHAREALMSKRTAQLAKLAELEEMQTKLAEKEAHVPTDVSKYARLLDAVREGDASANAAVALRDREGGEASSDGGGASAGATGAAATGAGGMDLDASSLPIWVASHFGLKAHRTCVMATIAEEELDEEVLLSMSRDDLHAVFTFKGAAATPAEPASYVGLTRLWLALCRRRKARLARATGETGAAMADGDEARATPRDPSRGVPPAEVAAWLRRVWPSEATEEEWGEVAVRLGDVGLDGAALCSLSREAWTELAASLLGPVLPNTEHDAGVVWTHLAPMVAVTSGSISTAEVERSAAEVDRLPMPLEGRKPFTVVVAGGTGAGKSTLVNALLGSEVLPTSCMRACTAAVIEVGWPEPGGAPPSRPPDPRRVHCQATLPATLVSFPHVAHPEGRGSARVRAGPVHEARLTLTSGEAWRKVVEEACAAAGRTGGKEPSEKEDPIGHVAVPPCPSNPWHVTTPPASADARPRARPAVPVVRQGHLLLRPGRRAGGRGASSRRVDDSRLRGRGPRDHALARRILRLGALRARPAVRRLVRRGGRRRAVAAHRARVAGRALFTARAGRPAVRRAWAARRQRGARCVAASRCPALLPWASSLSPVQRSDDRYLCAQTA